MKKKLILSLFSLFIVLLLSSCTHLHSYSKKYSSDRNYHWYECSCGEKSEKVPHTFDDGEVTKKATETEEGIMTYTCIHCDYSYGKKIPATGSEHVHSYDETTWKKDENKHWHQCECGQKSAEDNHTWNNGEVSTKPTEQTEGVRTFTCTVCGQTKTEPIDKLQHTHSYDVVTSSNDEYTHLRECECGESSISEEHNWDNGVITTPATEVETGIKTFTCTLCGRNKTTNIPSSRENGLSFTSSKLHKLNDKLSAVPRTIEAEVYLPTTYAERAGVIFGNYAENKQNFSLEVQSGGKLRLYYTDTANADVSKVSNVDIRTGAWAHVALVFDFDNLKVHFYLDGELAQSMDITTDLATVITNTKFVLGGDNRGGNSQFFKGQIRSVAAYADVRTAEEIADSCKNGTNAYADDLLVYYLVNENSASNLIVDLAKYKNDIDVEWFSGEQTELDYAYSFAVVGDTQILCQYYPEKMKGIYDWIIANKDSKKIAHVFGLGDITEYWGKTTPEQLDEWTRSKEYISQLDGVIPYSLIRGNHDESDLFNQTFGYDAYKNQFDGFMVEGDIRNSYKTFTVRNTDYMLVTLDFGATDEELDWANEVIATHPNHKVIITTHSYMYRDGTRLDRGDSAVPSDIGDVDSSPYKQYNDGQEMWDKLVSKHPNIVLVMSGHDPCEDVVTLQSTGIHGNTVTQMLIDPQGMDASKGGTAMVCMLYFSEDGSQMEVEWYSTDKQQFYKHKNQYTLNLYSAESTKHTFSNVYDETHHYQVCDCGYIHNKVEHIYDAGTLNDEQVYEYKCDCGHIKLVSSTINTDGLKLQESLEDYYQNGYYYKESVINVDGSNFTSFFNKDRLWISNGNQYLGYGTSANGNLTQFNVSVDGIFSSETEQNGILGMEKTFLTLHDLLVGSHKSEGSNNQLLKLDDWTLYNGVYTSTNNDVLEGMKLLLKLESEQCSINLNNYTFTKATIEEVNGKLILKLWVAKSSASSLLSSAEVDGENVVFAQITFGAYATTNLLNQNGQILKTLFTKPNNIGLCNVEIPTIDGLVPEYDKFAVNVYHNNVINNIYYSKLDKWDGTTVSTSLVGSGTLDDPYLIQSAADFVYLKTLKFNGEYFKLMTSIDLNNHDFSIDLFNGKFDGNHCSIRGINITSTTNDTGLFRIIESKSVISDLSLYGIVSGAERTGALAGTNKGIIRNVVNYATVSGAGNLGGLIGSSTYSESGGACSVTNCINYGKVNGTSWNNGGIVGFINGRVSGEGTLANCINYGEITAASCAGGIVGTAHITISHCLNYGTINTSNGGGIVYESRTIIEYCINYGDINGSGDNLGGILGQAQKNGDTIIRNCINNGTITGANRIGGILGYDNETGKATITNCINNGDITSTSSHGAGIIGSSKNASTTISHCTNNGRVNGVNTTGGIAGLMAGKIDYCTNNGYIYATSWNIGGIVGRNAAGSIISNCVNNSELYSVHCLGGISGTNQGTVTNCTNNGKITGGDSLGGIVYENVGTVTNCINNGVVTGDKNSGGIVFRNTTTGTISSCTNNGVVTATSDSTTAGGIVVQQNGTLGEGNVDNTTK